jgi:hypothetical protein
VTTDSRPHGYRAIRAIRTFTHLINTDTFLDGLRAPQDTGLPATASGANSGIGDGTTTLTAPNAPPSRGRPTNPRRPHPRRPPRQDRRRSARRDRAHREAVHAPQRTHPSPTTIPHRDLVGDDGNPIFCRQCLEQGARNPVDPKRPNTGECRLHAEWRLNPPAP